VSYDVYINYPVDHRLALLQKQEKEDGASAWEVTFEASLTEDVIDEDPTSGLDDRIPTFHGYSASGNVTAPVVYVNVGTFQDYEDLLKANVSLSGKIAIARYGGIFRGLKVKRAQELGMLGVIMYSEFRLILGLPLLCCLRRQVPIPPKRRTSADLHHRRSRR